MTIKTKQFALALFFTGAVLTLAQAQLTLKVTSIPANTPAGASIYVAGTFNNWDPGDQNMILNSLGGGQYQIVLNPAAGQVKFKFSRGSWATVEGNATGGYLADRVLNYSGQPTTVNLTILSWEDLAGGNGNGTAAPNVQILDNNFLMPQLNRNRRISLYLPPDYQTSNKSYPVMYMQDGQNLFDATTSFSGEWEVDESLNELFSQGDYGCIVVGIDNGGQYRLDEYSPWVNSEYHQGGQADEYLDFMVNTLKPYIDAHYRTLPGRLTTAVAGSSMGALFSMYAFSERQDIFSKAGIFSPAFWYSEGQEAQDVASHSKQGPARVYFISGTDEEQDGNQSNYVVTDMSDVANAMLTAGFTSSEINFQTKADGTHSESFWAREFPGVYQWLFANTVSSTAPRPVQKLEIFPNPAAAWVRVSGLDESDKVDFRIYNSAGKIMRDTTIAGDEPLFTGDLPTGVYVVKGRKKGGKWLVGRIVR